jgi:hypothetical protein
MVVKVQKQDEAIANKYTHVVITLLGVTAVSVFTPITWGKALILIGVAFFIMMVETVWRTMTKPETLDLEEVTARVKSHAEQNNIPLKKV